MTFGRLSESIIAQTASYDLQQDSDERRMLYCPLMVRGAVEFFCGRVFSNILSELTGETISRSPFSVPQLRINRGPAPELPVHTDSHASFNLATFFFVHQKWDEAAGGALQLYNRDEYGRFNLVKTILPRPNTLIGMIFSPWSYHGVSAITAATTRIAIYQEWQFHLRSS